MPSPALAKTDAPATGLRSLVDDVTLDGRVGVLNGALKGIYLWDVERALVIGAAPDPGGV